MQVVQPICIATVRLQREHFKTLQATPPMEKADFTVDTSDWKVFYKMNYDGNKGRLIAFAGLVAGTCGLGVVKLEPAASKAAEALAEEFAGIGEQLAGMAKAVRKHLKRQGLAKNKYIEMFTLQQALQILGAKICLEKKEIKKTLKDI